VSAREAIESELLAWMAESRRQAWPVTGDDARFADLALRLFAFQFTACVPYARFCRRRGVTPEQIRDWRAIPAVPTGAFKEVALRCFPESATRTVFRTSGTAAGRPGELSLDSLALYDASLRASLERLFLPDTPPDERLSIRVLAPSPEEAPHSSLSHMFGRLVKERGDDHSGFDVVGGELCRESLESILDEAVADGRAVALCGTAFAFVHWLDALENEGRRFRLPDGSRVMETGGFKGRSRELPRAELVSALGRALGTPPDRVVNQYGMTELASQFYDSVLVDPEGPRRKIGPPWARVRLLDPANGHDVPDGQVGMIAIHDLANTGSVAAILTADLGRRVADGFEVLGREPGAEERGCSIAADAMLGG